MPEDESCLQSFALGALAPVKMWTRGKNSARSLTEQRKNLWQKSGKWETSSHLFWCQNELSCPGATPKVWESTPRVLHLDEHTLKGGARALVLLSPPSPRRRLLTKPTGPLLCAFLWLSRLQKLQRTVLTVVRVTALEIVQKNTTQNNTIIQIDGISFEDFLLALVYRKKATPFENYMQLGVLFKSLS